MQITPLIPILNNNSIYNLAYQYIIGAKTVLGRNILNYKKREIDYIINYINERGNSGLILDLGCSTGQFTRALATKFGYSHVQGADVSLSSIHRCRKRDPDLTFHYIANEFYHENRGKYQYVLLSHVIEHMHNPKAFLRGLKGLFRGDGSLIICIPQERIRGDSALPENLYNLVRFKFENVHKVKYSLDSITLLLSEVGFLFRKSKYIHAFRPGKDQKSFANHSLVVFCELAQSKKVN
ncbi:MAG TPA: class I SAM-dependent methyltransferase [Candidatus Marinimicrobia bacterium]|nr:class I SAM-dependent methyltransferase [Candidatus Neomarinimicrobiota bacterium]HIO35672.1 class I SAM-dependent methyltransferase [Candidatus Neomarinimicrobiota bacterium]